MLSWLSQQNSQHFSINVVSLVITMVPNIGTAMLEIAIPYTLTLVFPSPRDAADDGMRPPT